jgi:hypothetical protein
LGRLWLGLRNFEIFGLQNPCLNHILLSFNRMSIKISEGGMQIALGGVGKLSEGCKILGLGGGLGLDTPCTPSMNTTSDCSEHIGELN